MPTAGACRGAVAKSAMLRYHALACDQLDSSASSVRVNDFLSISLGPRLAKTMESLAIDSI